MRHRQQSVPLHRDDVQGFDHPLGCLLEQRCQRGDVAVGALEPPETGAAMVVHDEVVRQCSPNPLEVAVVDRPNQFEQASWDVARRVAARVAFEHLYGGGAPVVGVEDDPGNDAAFGVDLVDTKEVDLERGCVAGLGKMGMLEHQ